MIARQEADGRLLLTYDSRRWSWMALAATALLLGTAAYDYWFGARGDDRLLGLVGSAATTFLIAFVMSEWSRFHVDPVRRRIEWEQGWAFRARGGTIPFDAVRHVSLETPIGDSGVPSRRVILHLTDGTTLPVTVGYRPDGDLAITHAAELLKRALGHSKSAPLETARLLIGSGKTFEAIRVLVDQEGLSVGEAKRRVDRLQKE
ncbi:MAG TPA: hypothetical protein VNT81_08675 [Vicinamibacterales bacterium]|nr:hypothetical protein [Vicinamibacterales bacterium]